MTERESAYTTIYREDAEGNIGTVVSVPITPNSKRVFKLMSEDYIELSFSLATAVVFMVGDYCDDELFGRFVIIDEQMPAYNQGTGGYDYTLKLEAPYMALRNKVHTLPSTFNDTAVRKETNWTLTDTLASHARVIVDNAFLSGVDCFNAVHGNLYPIEITAEKALERKCIVYGGIDMLSALKAISDAYETEWWVKDGILHFGKCEQSGEPVVFTLGGNVERMSIQDDVQDYTNSIFAYGGTQNVPSTYRRSLTFNVTKAVGTGFVDESKRVTLGMFYGMGTTEFTAGKGEGNDPFIVDLDGEMVIGNTSTCTLGGSLKGGLRITGNGIGVVTVKLLARPSQGQVTELESYELSITQGHGQLIPWKMSPKGEFELAQGVYTLRLQMSLGAHEGTIAIDGTKSVSSGNVTISAEPKSCTCKLLYNSSVYDVTFNPDHDEYGTDDYYKFTFDSSVPSGFGVGSEYSLLFHGQSYNNTVIDNGLEVTAVPLSWWRRDYDNPSSIWSIGENRLMLPVNAQSDYDYENNKLTKDGLSDGQTVERAIIFEQIHPQCVLVVTDVRADEMQTKEVYDDGSTTSWQWIQYTIKCRTLSNAEFPFRKSYIKQGETLQARFMTENDAETTASAINSAFGFTPLFLLAGMTFDVSFNTSTQEYTLKRNEDYGTKLPNETLKPSKGDVFTLINWDVRAMSALGLVETAEQKLLEKAEAYLDAMQEGQYVFTCDMMSGEDELDEGTRVSITHPALRNGSKVSRVIGYQFKLDKPYDSPQYTIGETEAYSRLKQIEKEITNGSVSTKGGHDSTSSSSSSVSSTEESSSGGGGGSSKYAEYAEEAGHAERADYATSSGSADYASVAYDLDPDSPANDRFLSSQEDDTAEGVITFEEGLVSNGNATFNGDVEIGDAQGSDNPTLTAHGDTEFNGNNIFNGRVTVDNTLDAQGDTELTGALETRQGTIEGYARLITRMLLGNYNGDFDSLDADGGFLDKDGNAELENLLVRSMAKITETVFRDMTSAKPSVQNSLSAFFEDGFGGHGMRMWHDDTKGWCMTLDTLRVRQTMYVYELVIQKIRAVGGILLVSAADGKIDTVQTVYVGINNVPHYLITFEDRNMFVEHDLMRCQKWSGNNYLGGDVDFDETHYDPSTSVHDTSETMKYYWVEVDYTMTSTNIPSIVTADDVGVTLGEKDILVRCDRFDDTIADPDTGEVYSVGVEPASGDECVLMGNTTDTARQNYIMISAAEDGVPRIDIKTGCNSVGNTGNLRTRVGCLDGIFDSYWPIDGQPNGYGLYSDNAWLKGKFVVKINNQDKDVGTQFEVLDGMVRSTVEATRQDLIGEEGHISNNMFFNRYDKWWLYSDGEIYVIPTGSVTLVSSDGYELADSTGTTLNDSTGMLVSTGGAEYARLVEDDTVGYCDVLEIKASSYNTRKGIVQKNADFRNLPIFETDETTQEIVKQNFMLTFYYYALTSSTVYTDLNGDVETTSLSATTDNRYHKVSIPYKWDGEGDFAIYGFGHFRIYGIVLTGNVDESMLDHYVTQIQQTARDITMSASAQVWNEETQQYDTVYFSQFYQTYNQFRSDVGDMFSQTESTINQTADNITMSVTEKIADSGNKYLNNASFNGWDKWTRNNTTAITSEVLNGMVILDMDAAQGQALTITQANADFKDKPTLFNDGNTPQPYPVVAEFYLEMVTSAIVLVSLGGVNMGTISTDETGRGFLRYKFSKGWDATGDFVITVRNGHVRIHSLMLNADTDAVTRSMISISSSQILLQVADDIDNATSGMVIESNFASLFSSQVDSQGIAKTATIETYVDNEIAGIELTADKIDLSGFVTANEGFSIDLEGNATMNNATIAGVLNNLIQKKTFSSANEDWEFNPLEWGSVIEWSPFGSGDSHVLVLPCAYASNSSGNMTINSNTGLTMRDLRQCIGKKFTFLCTAPSLNAGIILRCGDVDNGFLVLRQDYIGNNELDLYYNTSTQQGMAMNTPYNPVVQLTRMYQITEQQGKILGSHYFTAECKLGKYMGFECIYWEIYKSAMRGEVAYTISGHVNISNSGVAGAVVEFQRVDESIFRTITGRDGNYSIALYNDHYDIKVYANSTSQSAVYTESAYNVTTNQTKDFNITT